MKKLTTTRLLKLLVGLLLTALLAAGNLQAAEKPSQTTADHSKFKVLQGEFKTAPEVTEACLSCHTEAASQVKKTTHWTWLYDHEETGQQLGKSKVMNSFCGMVVTNEPRCTSCHIGYGWKDMNQPPPEADSAVDCLVCHDTTGGYKKFPVLSGLPTEIPREWPKGSGKMVLPPDLTEIAQHVGASNRATCGSCHFYGGGGDGVKHGDLDSSLHNPKASLDVHMAADGLNFSCSECHSTWGHDVAGSRYQVNAKDTQGVVNPGHGKVKAASCESCHNSDPHPQAKLNQHSEKIACQSCHIPEYARGGVATKMWWDWSTAGRLTEEGKQINQKDEQGRLVYSSQKGDFGYGENVIPTYAWFNGTVEYTQIEDEFDVSKPPLGVNRIQGSAEDPDSRIWPFKVMRGKQPFDTKNNTLLATHVFGADDTSFWKNFDWHKALQEASDKTGFAFSGEYDFIETTMHWPITHMVPSADQALECTACHSADSRLAGLPGIYMPGHDSNVWLDRLGWLAVFLTLAGVVVHRVALSISKRINQA